MSTAETQVAWSDAGYTPKEDQEPAVKFLGIYGKPGVKFMNLAAIPLLLMLTMFADTAAVPRRFVQIWGQHYMMHRGLALSRLHSGAPVYHV